MLAGTLLSRTHPAVMMCRRWEDGSLSRLSKKMFKERGWRKALQTSCKDVETKGRRVGVAEVGVA